MYKSKLIRPIFFALLVAIICCSLKVIGATVITESEISSAASNYGISTNSDAYTALKMINSVYAGKLSSSERSGKIVFLFEGVGVTSSTSKRRNAMCVVIDGGKIKYINRNCTTIPDYPFRKQSDGKATPTLKSGVHYFKSWNHQGDYAALKVLGSSAGASVAVVRHSSPSASPVNSTSDGINVHRRSGDSLGSNYSTGCQLIGLKGTGANDDYAKFIKAVGIVGSGATGTTKTTNGKYKGRIIIDRSFAYDYMKGIGYSDQSIKAVAPECTQNIEHNELDCDTDNRYPTPFIVYPLQTSGKIPVYNSSLTQYSLSQHYISWDDRCTVNKVYTNGYCSVTYPTSSGSSTYYTKLSYFIAGGLTPYNYSPPSDTDAYTRADMGDSLGEVFKTDNCKVVCESGNKLQVIYPTPNEYKCGWIYNSNPSVTGQYMEQGIGRTLADGNYYIVSAVDPSYYLDIHGTNVPAEDGDNVQLYQTDDGTIDECDVWTLNYEDGFYTITQLGTNQALDVYKESAEQGTNVEIWHSKNNSAQQWAISNNGDQGYRLQARCSGFSLDINTGVLSKGENIQQWAGNETGAQRWLFIPYQPEQDIEEGRYVLVSTINENYELDVPGDTSDVANNTGMRIWNDSDCLSKYNAFDITALGNGYYTLTNTESGKVLAAADDTMNKSQIILRAPEGKATEEWAITGDGENGYTLCVRHSGLAMDITNSEMTDGTKVIQYRHKRSENQIWKLVKAEHTIRYHAEESAMIPIDQTKYYRDPLVITEDIPIREGYVFCGWSISEDGNVVELLPGETITDDEDLDLYAVWKESGEVILPDNLTEIEEEAFYGSSAEIVMIPENCAKIGQRAFAECSHLREVHIPENTTQIAYDAFENSENVTLFVYEDSDAFWYAVENDIRYEIEGNGNVAD